MGKKYEHTHLINQAKTGAGRRALAARMPKVIETPKSALLLYGHATSNIGKALLGDLHILKKPGCRKLQRKNDLLPFEAGGETHLENLCRLNDCSLFAFTNHTKKRPDNLIVGRTFGFRILDMFEFGIEHFRPMALFKTRPASPPGSAPMVVFQGVDWPPVLQSTLLDWFRLPHDIKKLNVSGVDRVIVLTLKSLKDTMDGAFGAPANPNTTTRIGFKHYSVSLKKKMRKSAKANDTNDNGNDNDNTNGNDEAQNQQFDLNDEQEEDNNRALPKTHLTEIGPSFDLVLRRSQTAPESMRKDAMRQPKDPAAPKKKKNVSRDDLGDKIGRVHVGRQDLSDLSLARMKGLGKKRKASDLNDPASEPATPADIKVEEGDENDALSFVEDGEDAEGQSGQKRVRVDTKVEIAE